MPEDSSAQIFLEIEPQLAKFVSPKRENGSSQWDNAVNITCPIGLFSPPYTHSNAKNPPREKKWPIRSGRDENRENLWCKLTRTLAW